MKRIIFAVLAFLLIATSGSQAVDKKFIASTTTGGGSFYRYAIDQSLRCNDGDGAYLSRTPAGAGNTKTWVFSTWVKLASGWGVSYQGILNVGTFFIGTHSDYGNGRGKLYVYETGGTDLRTSAIYGDPSQWYHFLIAVDTTQAESNRVRIYVNGVQITSLSSATYPTASEDLPINEASAHYLGKYNGQSPYDGYLAQTCLLDGQSLVDGDVAITDFGTFVNGVWTPKDVSGLTFGTNGFLLDFANSADIGNDVSGNGNDWTPTNLAATDVVEDSPTNNFCTLNSVWPADSVAGTLSEGNLKLTESTAAYSCKPGTFSVSSGKWYFEMKYVNAAAAPRARIGMVDVSDSVIGYVGHDSGAYGYTYAGNKSNSASDSAYGDSFTTNDIVGCAIDMDNGKIWFHKNGTWQASGDPVAGTNEAYSGLTGTKLPATNVYQDDVVMMNFGQDSTNVVSGNADGNGYGNFEYAPPAGFLALCSANLSDPSWMTDPTTNTPADAFDVVTRTGTGAAASISSLNFSPDILWIKNRDQADSHHLHTSAMAGADYYIVPDSQTDDTQNANSVTSLNANGYSLGSGADGWNDNAESFVDFAWLKSATYGIDVLTFEGTGAAHTEAHSLSAVPDMMLLKNIDGGGNDSWAVYHSGVAADPETDYLILDTSVAVADLNTMWNDTAPTSTVFTVGTHDAVNASGQTIHAALFKSIPGFSSFGYYTGNGNADGPFIYTGFRPKWVLIKNVGIANWAIQDTERFPYNVVGSYLEVDTTLVEPAAAASYYIDIVSNGFKIRNTTAGVWNGSGVRYIYAAFAEFPFKYANAR